MFNLFCTTTEIYGGTYAGNSRKTRDKFYVSYSCTKKNDKGINNIVNFVVATGSTALTDKLKDLETTKVQLQESLTEAERKIRMPVLSDRHSYFY